MKVDSHIVRAIDQYIHDNELNADQFARMLGVSPASITKWHKVGNGITAMRWEELFPMLKKYLPKDRIYIDDVGKEQYSSAAAKQSSYFFEPKYVPQMVSTFSLDQIAEYDDTLESITQFGERLEAPLSEYRPRHKDKTSIFAIALDDDTFAPVFPSKTTLFACASERPVPGCLVIVFPVGATKPTIGRYARSDKEFSITPVGVAGDPVVAGNVADAKKLITWIFPVLYYEVIVF